MICKPFSSYASRSTPNTTVAGSAEFRTRVALRVASLLFQKIHQKSQIYKSKSSVGASSHQLFHWRLKLGGCYIMSPNDMSVLNHRKIQCQFKTHAFSIGSENHFFWPPYSCFQIFPRPIKNFIKVLINSHSDDLKPFVCLLYPCKRYISLHPPIHFSKIFTQPNARVSCHSNCTNVSMQPDALFSETVSLDRYCNATGAQKTNGDQRPLTSLFSLLSSS